MGDYDQQLTRKTKALAAYQPSELRRCLGCEHWMRSAGPEHRICNTCKGVEWRDEYSGGRVDKIASKVKLCKVCRRKG